MNWIEQSRSGNPFDDIDLMVAASTSCRATRSCRKNCGFTRWDLVVFDEAHKLSASYFGNKLKRPSASSSASCWAAITRHFLLMTATPHNGKEEDFQLFLSLLDSDRFYGKFRDGVHKVDVSDLMRRMVKEELLKFDGTPLFPERRAYTVNYKLSDLEAALYDAVTTYVKEEMNRADAPGRRQAQGHGRVRADRPAAPPRLQPRGHLPVPQAPPTKLKRRVEEEKLRQRGERLQPRLWPQDHPAG